MASKSNLVKKVVVDKNGHSTTRWVKQDDSGKASSVAIPAVALADTKPETDELLASIAELEAEQYRIQENPQGNGGLYAVLRTRSIEVARRSNNLDKLRVYDELFRVSDLDPRNVDRCIKVCSRALMEEAAGLVKAEHVRAVRSFTTALSDDEDYSGTAQRARDVLVDACIELSLKNIDDVPQILSLLNRGIRAPWELEEIIDDSRQTHRAVQDGLL